MLKQLNYLMSSAKDTSEFDVSGGNDPFLRCALLKLLKTSLLSSADFVPDSLKSDINEALISFARNYADPSSQAAHACGI